MFQGPPPGNNPVPRSSDRVHRPSNTQQRQIVIIEGHGEHRDNSGTFPVPAGVEIVIYQGMGAGMDDQHGIDIATGTGVPSRLPTLWDNQAAEYDTEPKATGGAVRQNTSGTRVYRHPDQCPDLTLLNPNEPGYPPINVQPGSVTAPLQSPILLSTIAAHNPNTQLHWAACTVRR